MIVITSPIPVANEISIIHSLFPEGLKLLHVRKPDFSEAEMRSFLSEIGLEFRARLVLHSHHHLAEDYGTNRLHFPKSNRNHAMHFSDPKWTKSTSVHTIDSFNKLNDIFNYAFLSPVYPSISKQGYHANINLLESQKQRTNFKTKLVALGGLSSENIKKTLENGFEEVALLGSIWSNSNPLKNFRICQQHAHSF
ncbi:MAG TPA: thiamine phosphate synthase [Flavobacterium sp.]|uniref:thiamine phosphate synthase n=1 Tax=Flavobacterium sp. TaxID=239 RepID=UPI002C7BEA32|nr:thiamine phosphate synthase [Flavobacterium sp.]HSD15159.1 thiamine phosphate synthase [Flavobacterium sp.]